MPRRKKTVDIDTSGPGAECRMPGRKGLNRNSCSN